MTAVIPRLAAAGLLLGALAAPGSAEPATASAPTDDPSASVTAVDPRPTAEDTFTLVTGDVVALGRSAGGSLAGRVVHDADPIDDVRFLGVGDRFYALPGVATPLLTSGRLDPQLFDLTALARYGYDDASTPGIPVIATAPNTLVGAMATPDGATRQRTLPSIDGAALTVDKTAAADFWEDLTPTRSHTARADGVGKLWLDRRVRASLDTSVPAIGAPAAWEAGYDGTGTTIAVLDTGIDAGHPDFAGRITATTSFVPGDDAHDDSGHGTHVASIAAGSGAASDGRYRGVAPGAELLAGKVLNDDGQGALSWVISGMEWAAGQGADVVNLSLGACCSAGDDPLSQAVNELSETTGTLFVAAAGNAEGAPLSVGPPAVADRALAVSNVDHRDGFAMDESSSRGPRRVDYAIKPDLAAPGTAITAAQTGSQPGPYATHTGTSMAAPHVAGAAAVLAQRHPDWTDERLADHLQSSTRRVDGAVASTHGTGVLDLAAATTSALTASGDVNLGRFAAGQTATASGEVTLRNDDDRPITLDLGVDRRFERVDVADYGTVHLPAGSVTVTPGEVTIPAAGAVTVEVTADLAAIPPGAYYGQLIARDGAGRQTVHTAIGWSEQKPRHPLTVDGIERDGGQPSPWTTYAVATSRTHAHATYLGDFRDGQARTWLNLWDGTLTDRLPEDEYGIVAKLGPFDQPVFAGGRNVTLDRGRSLSLDARDARPIRIETPRPSVAETAWWGWRQLGPEELYDQSWSTRPGDLAYQLLPDRPDRDYRLLFNTRRVAPHLRKNVDAEEGRRLAEQLTDEPANLRAEVDVPSPYVYDLYYPARPTRVDGTYRIRHRDLATVRTRFHAPEPGATLGEVSRYSYGWDGYVTGPIPTPYERIDYVVPGRARISTVSTRNLGDRNHEYVSFTPALKAGRGVVRDVGGAPMAPGPLRGQPLLVSTADGAVFDTDHEGFEDLYRNYPWPLVGPDGSGGLARSYTAQTRVLRHGVAVCDQPGLFTCPITQDGQHRIVVDTQQNRMPLSTSTHTEWTLDFRHRDADQPADHPLPVVRWLPRLDLSNATPGRTQVVPLRVGYQPGSTARSRLNVTAWATYDDGATWTRIHFGRVGRSGKAYIVIRPPRDHNGYVGLRVQAEDRHGNAVDQTIIRASRLR